MVGFWRNKLSSTALVTRRPASAWPDSDVRLDLYFTSTGWAQWYQAEKRWPVEDRGRFGQQVTERAARRWRPSHLVPERDQILLLGPCAWLSVKARTAVLVVSPASPTDDGAAWPVSLALSCIWKRGQLGCGWRRVERAGIGSLWLEDAQHWRDLSCPSSTSISRTGEAAPCRIFELAGWPASFFTCGLLLLLLPKVCDALHVLAESSSNSRHGPRPKRKEAIGTHIHKSIRPVQCLRDSPRSTRLSYPAVRLQAN
ncbi:hypothetical protein QBC47DRAFT_144171 [Echria macrotheca]|uniref:Uncharacterized protein n=1 Tax=Echria macrotheca TaxID=438768 RepID=A0AAJ0BHT2_9PEZI|nr:hypothetical protein QBC47DRAFT_144171 [Echria macrotheca]